MIQIMQQSRISYLVVDVVDHPARLCAVYTDVMGRHGNGSTLGPTQSLVYGACSGKQY